MEALRSLPNTSKLATLVAPGAILFIVLLVLCIGLRSLSFWYVASLLFGRYGIVPITFGSALIGIAWWQWRRHWISGLCVLCAPIFVFMLGAFPNPVASPTGWAANIARVCYFRSELERSYVDAKNRGESVPVGQLYLDGFGSLTSGLAYDPSREIAMPVYRRSASWVSGPGQTELGLKNLEVHHVVGSYYYWFHD
jgi:hypothetical protein